MKVKVISLPYILQVLYALCFTRPRYQVSVYRTIGPLVLDVVFWGFEGIFLVMIATVPDYCLLITFIRVSRLAQKNSVLHLHQETCHLI